MRARARVLQLLKAVQALSITMLLVCALSCSEDQPSELDNLWLSFVVHSGSGMETRLQIVQNGDYLVLRVPAEPRVMGTLSAAHRTRLEALLVPERMAIYADDSLWGASDPKPVACVADAQNPKAYTLVVGRSNATFCWKPAGLLGPETLELVEALEGIIASHSD